MFFRKPRISQIPADFLPSIDAALKYSKRIIFSRQKKLIYSVDRQVSTLRKQNRIRKRTPCLSSIISLPTLANVVHLQLLIVFATQRLCTLHLHTSQLRPCEVTPDDIKIIEAKLSIRNTRNHILSHIFVHSSFDTSTYIYANKST